MGRSNFIDPEKWSERLGLPYVKRFWYNYEFGGNLGNRQGSKRKVGHSVGKICNFSGKDLSNGLNLILDSIIAGDWSNCVNLYAGLIAFCLKYCADDIEYYEDNRSKSAVSVKKCCEELKFPTWCRSKMEKVFKMQLSLSDYLHAFDNVEQTKFDVNSALIVHQLQGDKAIFSILMQLFFSYKYVDTMTANLVPELPIIWTPEVSNLVTGTSFPVVATKFSNKFEWINIDDSFFLFDEFNNVIDCANVHMYNVFQETLGNRLTFLHRSGVLPEYVVCWNWGDLVDAVGHFNGDILVRNLGGGYNGWFKFGPNGELAVKLENNRVYSKKGTKYIPNVSIESYPNEGKWIAIATLDQKRADDIIGEEVVWNFEEMCDWFELGRMCKEKLEKN